MVSREDIQKMVESLLQRSAPEKVILFGPYARGEASAESDSRGDSAL